MATVVRRRLEDAVRRALRRGRVVALVGPRQAGKTTLARAIVRAASPNYFDLENPSDVARLAEPMTASLHSPALFMRNAMFFTWSS